MSRIADLDLANELAHLAAVLERNAQGDPLPKRLIPTMRAAIRRLREIGQPAPTGETWEHP